MKIMKKTYLAPVIMTMTIEVHQMICGSQLNPDANSQSIKVSDEVVDEFTARGGWFDEDEE